MSVKLHKEHKLVYLSGRVSILDIVGTLHKNGFADGYEFIGGDEVADGFQLSWTLVLLIWNVVIDGEVVMDGTIMAVDKDGVAQPCLRTCTHDLH